MAATTAQKEWAALKVHSFHLNIDRGDCSIHLLVDETTSPKKTVHNAVLIDGGLSTDDALFRIEERVQEIESIYQPDPSGHFDPAPYDTATPKTTWLRFDAIMVTHWDVDHYGGVFRLLQSGFQDAARAPLSALVKQLDDLAAPSTPSKPEDYPATGTRDEKIEWINDNSKIPDYVAKGPGNTTPAVRLQNRWLKYDASNSALNLASDTGSLGDPLTTFYSPYCVKSTVVDHLGNFLCPEGYDTTKCWKTDDANYLSFSIQVRVPEGIKNLTEKLSGVYLDSDKYLRITKTCKLVADFSNYLGVDLFKSMSLNDTSLALGSKTVTYDTIKNPGQLVKHFKLKRSDGPRLYIIAGNQIVLGDVQTSITAGKAYVDDTDPFFKEEALMAIAPAVPNGKPFSEPPSKSRPFHMPIHEEGIIDDPGTKTASGEKGEGRPLPRITSPSSREKHSFEMNSPSICCMILNATDETFAQSDEIAFEMKHYLGGDSLWDTESAIALWLTTTTKPPKPLSIEVMKLSHHGASASSPVNLIQQLKPKRVICSLAEGRQRTRKWGHPRWELVLYLAACLKSWWQDDNTRTQQSFFLTNPPPYYNLRDVTKNEGIVGTLDAFYKKGAEGDMNSVYRSCLNTVYDEANPKISGTENVMEAWMTDGLTSGDDHANSQIEMANRLEPLFRAWDAAGWESLPALGSGGGTRQLDDNQIYRCIEVRIKAGTTEDTEIYSWKGQNSGVGRPVNFGPVAKPADPPPPEDPPRDEMVVCDDSAPPLSGTAKRKKDDDEEESDASKKARFGGSVGGLPGKAATDTGKGILPNFTGRAMVAAAVASLGSESGPNTNTTLDDLVDAEQDLQDDDFEGGYFGDVTAAAETDAPPQSIMAAHLAHAPGPLQLHALNDPFFKSSKMSSSGVGVARTVVAANNPLIYVYSMDFLDPATAQSPSAFHSNQVFLDGAANAPFSSFVGFLKAGFLACTPPVQNTGSQEFVLDSTDDLFQRLKPGNGRGLGVTAFSMFGSVVQNQGQAYKSLQINKIQAKVTIGGSTVTFDSSKSAAVCGLPPPLQTSPQPGTYADAIVQSDSILSLGVSDVPKDLSLKLSDLLPSGTWLYRCAELFSISGQTFTIDATNLSRSAISIQPDDSFTSWLRLQLVPSADSTWKLSDALPFLQNRGIAFNDSHFIVTKLSSVLRGDTAFTVSSVTILMFRTSVTITTSNNASFTVDMWWVFNSDSTNIIFSFRSDQNFEILLDWLVDLLKTNPANNDLSGDDIHPQNILKDLPNTGSTPQFWIQQLSLTVTKGSSSSSATHCNFSIAFQVDLFGAAFKIIVSGPPVTLTAQLWTVIPDPMIVSSSFPYYPYLPFLEQYMFLHPMGSNVSGVIDLSNLIGSGDAYSSRPCGLSASITDLYLQVRIASGTKSAAFRGTITCETPSSSPSFPDLILGELSLWASFSSASTPASLEYDVGFKTDIWLFDQRTPAPETPADPIHLDVSLDVNDGVWTVSAEAVNLQFAGLYQILDSDSNESVADILSHFSVPYFSIQYVYQKGAPSTLIADGTIALGPVELDLFYSCTAASANTPKSWTIQAHLGLIPDASHNLVDIVGELDPDLGALLDDVPFVRDCSIPASGTPGDTQFADAPLQILVTSQGAYTVMCFRLEINTPVGSLSCTCVRWKNTKDSTTNGRAKPKLILRVALDKLPALPKIPVVGSLQQPVDSIDYVLVSDTNPITTVYPQQGVTTDEIANINNALGGAGITPIPYRQVMSDFKSSDASGSAGVPNGGNAKPSAPAMLNGHHFIVVASKEVIIDHLFGGSPPVGPNPGPSLLMMTNKTQFVPSDPKKTTTVSRNFASLTSDPPNAATEDSGITHGNLQKKGDPLTVNNFGIQVKDGKLFLVLDFTVSIGPVQLTAVGFRVGVSLSAFHLNTLKNLTVEDFDVDFSGLSIYGNAPPVLIAGVFIHQDTTQYELYEGGLAVSILPYTLVAVGAYRDDKVKNFKSFFLFARFDGPLLSLEFAEISGVELGFGYNYDLTMPDPHNILDYPLLHGQTATNNPMDIIDQFGRWTTPLNGSYWFAVGCKIDSFEVLSIDAAIMISFSADDVKVGIAGIATASMPPMVQKREEAFLYVELGISGAIDIGGGSVVVSASLTPNSFILYPDCHLTGGFALAYWFKGSKFEGDWVFTVGGYHPAFKVPSYYPQVDRVGITWNLSDVLTITGGGFFAITPKIAMGGGLLKAVFNAGIVYACFQAWASFLINFKPFFFIADIGVSISCGVHISLGLIDIYITADISADVHLKGPPFGGTAYVDLKVHTFSIDFGDQGPKPDMLDWPDFLNVVRQTGISTTETGDKNVIIVGLVDGAMTENTKSTQTIGATTSTSVSDTASTWSVRAGTFKFRVESKVPVDKISVDDGSSSAPITSSDNPSAAYAGLMKLDNASSENQINSTLSVHVVPKTAAAAFDNGPYAVEPMFKNLPAHLWNRYSSSSDPLEAGNNVPQLLDGSSGDQSVPHCTGYLIKAPNATLPPPSTWLPEFNAVEAMQEGVFPDGGALPRKDRRPLLDPALTDDERPRLPHCADAANASYFPNASSQTRTWKTVKSAWTATSDSDAQIIADIWTEMLGWDAKDAQPAAMAPVTPPAGSALPPPVYPIQPFTALTGSKPTMVLNDFDDMFLSLPQICNGVGA